MRQLVRMSGARGGNFAVEHFLQGVTRTSGGCIGFRLSREGVESLGAGLLDESVGGGVDGARGVLGLADDGGVVD